MKKNILLIALLIMIFVSACNMLPDFREGIVLEEFVYKKAYFPSCHASTIAETPRGLITAFFGGTYEGILMIVST
ncbi:MAG: sialidase family protein [Bacteroidota bacterium]